MIFIQFNTLNPFFCQNFKNSKIKGNFKFFLIGFYIYWFIFTEIQYILKQMVIFLYRMIKFIEKKFKKIIFIIRALLRLIFKKIIKWIFQFSRRIYDLTNFLIIFLNLCNKINHLMKKRGFDFIFLPKFKINLVSFKF